MKHMKVLVVEDDDLSRLFLGTLCRDEGFDVQEAADGAEGFQKFESFGPDLIFSDYSMPVMDGLEMLEKIRKKNLDTVVIMTTAFGDAEYTLRALRLRANDYLVKPINPKDIIGILGKYENILSSRTVEREVLGMILYRDFAIQLGNRLDIVGKVVDRLMQETDGFISSIDRLGIHLGLAEIITNAIEHGNLGITYDEKSQAMEGGFEVWKQFVEDRQSTPPYDSRKVLIEFHLDSKGYQWTITDEGAGFDWQSVPDFTEPENLLSSHGRGILLAQIRFDSTIFVGNGNKVILRKNLRPKAT